MQLDDYVKLPYTITLKPDEDGDWIAEIEELEGCVAHGETQAEALRRIDEAKHLWIQASLEHGQPIPNPVEAQSLPSGKWLQRVPRTLHRNLSRLAKVEGTSLNQLVTSILSAHVGAGRKSQEIATSGAVAFISMPTMSPMVWGMTGVSVIYARELGATFHGTVGQVSYDLDTLVGHVSKKFEDLPGRQSTGRPHSHG